MGVEVVGREGGNGLLCSVVWCGRREGGKRCVWRGGFVCLG